MVFDSPGCAKIFMTLAALHRQRATGKLVLANEERQWHFYLRLGHLLYAIESKHRVRRWERAIRFCCPDYRVTPHHAATAANLWEFQLLQQSVKQAQLNVHQAKAVIRAITKEVFFTLMDQWELNSRWLPASRQPSPQNHSSLPLSLRETEQVLQKAHQLWQQWHEMGLSHLDPDQAPILNEENALNQASSETLLSLSQLFNGQHTLWDLAVQKKQCVTVVTRTLHYFVKQGVIAVREVSDVPSPIEQLRMIAQAVQPNGPLIACIDDSAVVCQSLETILVPVGYRVLKIQDPLGEMSTLVQQKPALIFLDLIMPDPSGYAICSFLRQTSVFKETPIIILTGHDGVVERVRTKFTGASDFLSKPPVPQKVLEILQKHLHVHSTAPKPFPTIAPAMA
jgi:chemotaxis family two-component system response regulator PixG